MAITEESIEALNIANSIPGYMEILDSDDLALLKRAQLVTFKHAVKQKLVSNGSIFDKSYLALKYEHLTERINELENKLCER